MANLELTPELAFQLGRAGSYVLARHEASKRPRILAGKDIGFQATCWKWP